MGICQQRRPRQTPHGAQVSQVGLGRGLRDAAWSVCPDAASRETENQRQGGMGREREVWREREREERERRRETRRPRTDRRTRRLSLAETEMGGVTETVRDREMGGATETVRERWEERRRQ